MMTMEFNNTSNENRDRIKFLEENFNSMVKFINKQADQIAELEKRISELEKRVDN